MTSDLQILLVEDNPGDADLIGELLEQGPANSHQITKQATLGDALDRLRTDTFDLVLLDLGLPDSQGLETLRGLLTAAPLLPVVVLTGFDDEATGIATVHEGAQDYLVKGQFDGAVLSRVIRYAIERQQSIRKIKRLNNILSAIREINQLIVREKDSQGMIEKGSAPWWISAPGIPPGLSFWIIPAGPPPGRKPGSAKTFPC